MEIDYDEATKEFITLLQNLEATGLHVEVRPGYEQTILLFVKAPSELLGNRVYKLRYICPHANFDNHGKNKKKEEKR